MRPWCWALLATFLAVWPAGHARAQTVTFDFDTGVPALSIGQNTPFDQSWSGVIAQFSSPGGGGAYSVQSDASTGYGMSQFSGKYMWPNTLDRSFLDIHFSQRLSSITLVFATADFQQVEIPTTIQLTAYVDSTATPAVGSATAHGTYAGDTMPMGTLSFSSGTPFNLVRIGIPFQPLAAPVFLVDNITVTTVVVSAPRTPRRRLHQLACRLVASEGLFRSEGREICT
jgi:hypothetical protein